MVKISRISYGKQTSDSGLKNVHNSGSKMLLYSERRRNSKAYFSPRPGEGDSAASDSQKYLITFLFPSFPLSSANLAAEGYIEAWQHLTDYTSQQHLATNHTPLSPKAEEKRQTPPILIFERMQ
ncbi:hypothetical protein ElyMa_007005700 [Elysia marginata]|uniref:Uncharacterized protein n=1 Tax=Elysia marginata TaxID=1093978 RepID=A0AAV4JRD2_9GAST|nr:hypothetical protein ElyMa_007005700 [Elysia marginata]